MTNRKVISSVRVPPVMVSLRKMKERFAKDYPDHPFTRMLLEEPDRISADELFSKIGHWTTIAALPFKEQVILRVVIYELRSLEPEQT